MITVDQVVTDITVDAVNYTVSVTYPGLQGPAGMSGTQPIFSVSGVVLVTSGKHRFYVERPGTVTKLRASVGTAPIGSALTVELWKNSADLVASAAVADGELTHLTSDLDVPLIAGDYLTVDVTGVGSTTPGADLTVSVTIE